MHPWHVFPTAAQQRWILVQCWLLQLPPFQAQQYCSPFILVDTHLDCFPAPLACLFLPFDFERPPSQAPPPHDGGGGGGGVGSRHWPLPLPDWRGVRDRTRPLPLGGGGVHGVGGVHGDPLPGGAGGVLGQRSDTSFDQNIWFSCIFLRASCRVTFLWIMTEMRPHARRSAYIMDFKVGGLSRPMTSGPQSHS